MIENLKQQWVELGKTVSRNNDLVNSFWLEIEQQYSLKIRHYHNLNHIKHILTLAKSIKSSVKNYTAFLFAIWYHDVIYKPHRKDNELKSAAIAKNRLTQLNFDSGLLNNIEKLIISTKNHTIILDENTDNAFLLDIDLSILGSHWDTYSKYMQQIRKEYAMYPDVIYRKGRQKVIQYFLARETLYFTDTFQNNYEKNARQNLTKELALL